MRVPCRLPTSVALQLARVAMRVTCRPTFLKRLKLVLRAVSSLVRPDAPTHITPKMMSVMTSMAARRMGDVFKDENLAGARVALDLSALGQFF